MRDFDLKKLQTVEYEMLKDVTSFCKKNGIVYYLDSGTLLGAVRHGGFIPWDDDIDICMDVKNYKKFLRLAPKGLPERYFVQNYKTDTKSCIRWTHVRINDTTSMERELTNYDIHYGICMDIFVMAGIADTALGKRIQNFACKWQSVLLEKYICEARKLEVPWHTKILYKWLPEQLRLLIISLLEKLVLKDTGKCKSCFNVWSRPEHAIKFPSYFYDEKSVCDITFEDSTFTATKYYKMYLELAYGDWKQLPPVEERGGHGDIIVDFENSYKKYYTGE